MSRLTIFSVCIFFFYSLALVSAENSTETEIVELFSEGKRLFRQALELSVENPEDSSKTFLSALTYYERIVRDGGIQNGKLFYNIGNIYFRMSDIGRAILAYNKAKEFIPNDPNLLHNMTYARSQRRDDIEQKQTRKVLQTILFWHYDVSPQNRFLVFAVSFTAVWGFAVVYLFFKKPSIAWGIGAAAVLAFFLFGSLVSEEIQKSRFRTGVIVAEQITARKGDSESYQSSFREPLHAGTEFHLLEERKNWYYIELADGRRTWIPAASAGMVDKFLAQ